MYTIWACLTFEIPELFSTCKHIDMPHLPLADTLQNSVVGCPQRASPEASPQMPSSHGLRIPICLRHSPNNGVRRSETYVSLEASPQEGPRMAQTCQTWLRPSSQGVPTVAFRPKHPQMPPSGQQVPNYLKHTSPSGVRRPENGVSLEASPQHGPRMTLTRQFDSDVLEQGVETWRFAQGIPSWWPPNYLPALSGKRTTPGCRRA